MAAPSTASATSVFEIGNYTTRLTKMEVSDSNPPPKPLLFATPCEAGNYPILIFLHGYLFYNDFYSQLIQHVSSHGFIVIAPQLYTLAGADATDEIESTASLTNWLSKGALDDLLPQAVHPNLAKLGLAGHSRGGKVAFALALCKATTKLKLKFSALVGVDPVDGKDIGKQTPPPVLTYVPNSFDLNMAVMVIGSGLGEIKRSLLFPPCAPKGINHEEFFRECQKPACYFVAKDYGHVDMLDDETDGIRGKVTYCLCKNGKSREPMRRFVGGAIVAFLKAYLNDDKSDLIALKYDQSSAPVELGPVEFLE